MQKAESSKATTALGGGNERKQTEQKPATAAASATNTQERKKNKSKKMVIKRVSKPKQNCFTIMRELDFIPKQDHPKPKPQKIKKIVKIQMSSNKSKAGNVNPLKCNTHIPKSVAKKSTSKRQQTVQTHIFSNKERGWDASANPDKFSFHAPNVFEIPKTELLEGFDNFRRKHRTKRTKPKLKTGQGKQRPAKKEEENTSISKGRDTKNPHFLNNADVLKNSIQKNSVENWRIPPISILKTTKLTHTATSAECYKTNQNPLTQLEKLSFGCCPTGRGKINNLINLEKLADSSVRPLSQISTKRVKCKNKTKSKSGHSILNGFPNFFQSICVLRKPSSANTKHIASNKEQETSESELTIKPRASSTKLNRTPTKTITKCEDPDRSFAVQKQPQHRLQLTSTVTSSLDEEGSKKLCGNNVYCIEAVHALGTPQIEQVHEKNKKSASKSPTKPSISTTYPKPTTSTLVNPNLEPQMPGTRQKVQVEDETIIVGSSDQRPYLEQPLKPVQCKRKKASQAASKKRANPNELSFVNAIEEFWCSMRIEYLPEVARARKAEATAILKAWLAAPDCEEHMLGIQMAPIFIAQIGGDQVIIDHLTPFLVNNLKNNLAPVQVRAKSCASLAVIKFLEGISLADRLLFMQLFESIFCVCYKYDPDSEQEGYSLELSELYAKAISAWQLLATQLPSKQLYMWSRSDREVVPTPQKLLKLLEFPHHKVRIATCQCIALMLETGRQSRCYFWEQHIYPFRRSVARFLKEAHRLNFLGWKINTIQSVLEYLRNDAIPAINFIVGHRYLVLNTWAKQIKYAHILTVFGKGLYPQLARNEYIRKHFEFKRTLGIQWTPPSISPPPAIETGNNKKRRVRKMRKFPPSIDVKDILICSESRGGSSRESSISDISEFRALTNVNK